MTDTRCTVVHHAAGVLRLFVRCGYGYAIVG